jgi:hypothetical protein
MTRTLRWMCATALVVAGLTTQRGEGQTPEAKPVPHEVASTPWSAEQGGWAGRLVVDEYSTGLGCEICHQDEQAIHGLMRRYPATAFIGLAYHMNYDWFWSDPTEDIFDRFIHWFRYDYPGQVDHSLALDDVIDGRKTWPVAFANDSSGDTMPQWIYHKVVPKVDAELRRPPEAFIRAQTTVHDGQIRVRVTLDSTKRSSPTSYGLILRLLLVGDTVPLYSKNAVSPALYNLVGEQYMVVYAVAHTPLHVLGIPIPLIDGAGSPSSPIAMEHTFDVAAIQRRILGLRRGDTTLFAQNEDTYTSNMSKKDLLESGSGRFTDERDWRLNPLRLRVVALVQDAGSGEVLQAALVPVDGKRLVLR